MRYLNTITTLYILYTALELLIHISYIIYFICIPRQFPFIQRGPGKPKVGLSCLRPWSLSFPRAAAEPVCLQLHAMPIGSYISMVQAYVTTPSVWAPGPLHTCSFATVCAVLKQTAGMAHWAIDSCNKNSHEGCEGFQQAITRYTGVSASLFRLTCSGLWELSFQQFAGTSKICSSAKYKTEITTTSEEFPYLWIITNKYKYPLCEKMEADASKRKHKWKCHADFSLFELNTHMNTSLKLVPVSTAAWNRSNQEDAAFDGFCGNWNGNLEPLKVKLLLSDGYNLCKWLCSHVILWDRHWLPAAIQTNSHIIQKAQQAAEPVQDFQGICTKMF